VTCVVVLIMQIRYRYTDTGTTLYLLWKENVTSGMDRDGAISKVTFT